MTKCITLLTAALIFSYCSTAQKTRFTQIVEQMYFNVFKRNPDAPIRPFIKRYFPDLLSWKNEKGPYYYENLYRSDPPKFDPAMHSFSFSQHPLIQSKFKRGRFDFITYEDKGSIPLIVEWLLSFTFESEGDAQSCFDDMCKLFDSASKDNVIFETNSRKIAQYTHNAQLNDFNCIEFLLVKDDLYDNQYKIYFRTGRFYHKENTNSKEASK